MISQATDSAFIETRLPLNLWTARIRPLRFNGREALGCWLPISANAHRVCFIPWIVTIPLFSQSRIRTFVPIFGIKGFRGSQQFDSLTGNVNYIADLRVL